MRKCNLGARNELQNQKIWILLPSRKKVAAVRHQSTAKLAALLWEWLGRGALVWRHAAQVSRLPVWERISPWYQPFHSPPFRSCLPRATGSSYPAEERRRRPRGWKSDSRRRVRGFRG